MPLTATQARTAQAIVNLFETGQVLGDYGQVTLIEGDSGHLTFGRTQTTLGSGNLHRLVETYCANAGALFGTRLEPYLPRLAAADLSLDHDGKLHNLLRASADDSVMRETQDQFFDQFYWQPAVRAATKLGITSPLGTAVVYDGHVHGSWARLRDRTSAAVGAPAKAGERRWIGAYVAARRHWLGTSTRQDLRATVYRMDAFQRLIELGQWGLELPLVVRGREISEFTLAGTPPGCYDGPAPGSRVIGLQAGAPLPRGLDVRRLQLGLSDRGADIRADGVYGQASAAHVKAFQHSHRLPATGIADIALITRLAA
jgi:chitosanase